MYLTNWITCTGAAGYNDTKRFLYSALCYAIDINTNTIRPMLETVEIAVVLVYINARNITKAQRWLCSSEIK